VNDITLSCNKLKCVTYKRKPEEKHFFIEVIVCGKSALLEILIANQTNSTRNGDGSQLT
ncbi:hypothetical protein BgiMline_031453, partial [Biomphalaria glabrata]